MSSITPSELAGQSNFLPWPKAEEAILLAQLIIEAAGAAQFDDRDEFAINVAESVMPIWNHEVWNLVVQLGLYESESANNLVSDSTSPTHWARLSLFQTIYELAEVLADIRAL
jgi:hypothetical protein